MCTNLNNAFSPFRSQSFAIYSHQLDALALDLFEKARKAKISVTRDVIRSFGRSAKTTLLKAPTTSADVRERLNDFKAGERWGKNFLKRNGLHSSKLLGEAASTPEPSKTRSKKLGPFARSSRLGAPSMSTRQAFSGR